MNLIQKLADFRAKMRDGDFEAAHAIEDEVLLIALQMIAEGHQNPKHIAKLALKTQDYVYPRWCA